MDLGLMLDKVTIEIESTKELYRYLHQHPELSFKEYQTREFIAEQLHNYGYEDIQTNVGGGGIIARLVGGQKGPTIAFRADIDALAIHEETDLPYRSVNDGVMHACGHDAHTAILLSVAKQLIDYQSQIKGTIVFLFQHAEEVKPGGAISILKSGALDDVDKIFGLHVRGELPFDGAVEYCQGYALAASDTFNIRIQGNGGHAATPHKTVDSTVVAAFLVQQLQTIVSRNKNPLDSGVVTVANFHSGGGAGNVIADYATLSGTVRTYNPELRQMIKQRIHELTEHICQAHSATAYVDYLDGYPPLINHFEETALIQNLFETQFGQDHVFETEARMGGEDFAYYLEKIPGSFYYIRAGAFEEENYPHHHPKFQIDEDCLQVGIETILTIMYHYHFSKVGVLQ
ncbi:MAG: amidohydrolase [Gallicola sp.]|nr:amidohydrolase [Gallicola sp.]